MLLYSDVRFVVASVVPKRESMAATISFAVPVVSEMVGFPPHPEAMFEASSGEDWCAPVKEAAVSLIESVAPVMVTETVLEPDAGLARYQDFRCHASPSRACGFGKGGAVVGGRCDGACSSYILPNIRKKYKEAVGARGSVGPVFRGGARGVATVDDGGGSIEGNARDSSRGNSCNRSVMRKDMFRGACISCAVRV